MWPNTWTLLLIFNLGSQTLPGYKTEADCTQAYVDVWNNLTKKYNALPMREEWHQDTDGKLSRKLLPPTDFRPISYVCVQVPNDGINKR